MNDFYANQIVDELKKLNDNLKEIKKIWKEVKTYGL